MITQTLHLLGERISLLRRAREWTQAEMADLMGVRLSTLAQIEKGNPGVSSGALARALWALDKLAGVDKLAELSGDAAVVATAMAHFPSA